MKRFFKKGAALFACLMLLVGLPITLQAEEDLPSRAVYVVYDDSGSMYQDYDNDEMVDTWSKAKYSMEVFASMIAPRDTMNIFYMSDYSEKGDKDGPRIEISGEEKPSENVSKIHDEKTTSGKTPFETVEAAYESLEQTDADEKWLVVLTDGDFQKNGLPDNDKNKVTAFMNEFFSQKDPDVKVAFLAMGDSVVPITENKDEDIYFYRASKSDEILEEVTEISNRIFNANRLDVAADTGKFTLDIPMSSLTIFAQGDGVEIEGLTDEKDEASGSMNPAVTVSATDKSDNDAHKDNPPAKELRGEVAVFDGPFAPGNYQIKAKNAKKIEVYFKPLLEVAAYLTTSDGQRIDDFSDLPTGDYQIHFELLNGIDHQPLPQKNIVNQSEYGIDYKAEIYNNGQLQDKVFGDGDTLHINQGSLDIDVTATYLNYNTSKTKLQYSVWKEKTVTFEKADSPAWTLDQTLTASEPLKVLMRVEGETPTEEEWSEFKAPEITAAGNDETNLENPIVTKGSVPGELLIEPNDQQTDFEGVPYEQALITISVNEEVGSIPWVGDGEADIQIQDERPFWIKNRNWWIAHWWLIPLLLALIVIAAGYLPWFKKYLPGFSKKQTIEIHPLKSRREKDSVQKVELKKDLASTLVPYKTQTGHLRVIPSGDYEGSNKKMQLKGIRVDGSQRAEISNLKSFQNLDLTVNGQEYDPNMLVQQKSQKQKGKKSGNQLNLKKGSVIVIRTTDYEFTTRLK